MDIHDTRRDNLKWLIEHAYEGIAANLARALGIQPAQLSRVFTRNPRHRRNIGSRFARAIERASNLRQGWMDEAHLIPDQEGSKTVTVKPNKAVVLTPFGDKMVPVLDYEQAWQWTASEKPYPVTNRTEIIWTRISPLSERAFGLVIKGESMVGEFYPGDIVIVDPEIPPKPGDFVVAKLEKEDKAVFRKYRPRGFDQAMQPIIELAPLNEDYPSSMIDSHNPGYIIGTMVEHRKYRRTDRLSVPELHTTSAKRLKG
jgi:SOS-response transcriptional repressor LexA